MPVIDTEVLFALNPNDPKHDAATKLLKQNPDLKAPDTTLLEFQLVLRGRGRTAEDVSRAILSLRKVLATNHVSETKTIDTRLLALQGQIEMENHLSYFDSLVAASALVLDEEIVTDDKAFEAVPNLTRTPFAE